MAIHKKGMGPYCPHWQMAFWQLLPGRTRQGYLFWLLSLVFLLQTNRSRVPTELSRWPPLLGELSLVSLFRITVQLFCSHLWKEVSQKRNGSLSLNVSIQRSNPSVKEPLTRRDFFFWTVSSRLNDCTVFVSLQPNFLLTLLSSFWQI